MKISCIEMKLKLMLTLAEKMLLSEHKKANMFSHAIMADVKNVNQHLHLSDNLKYSEKLGMRKYWRFLRSVPGE